MASFEQLLRRFQQRVLHFLQQRGGNEAEDIAQETFLRAFERLQRYRRQWPFAAWLFTIARRTAINHNRRMRPAGNATALAAAESSLPGPAERLDAEETRGRIWDVAARILSEDEVTALWLHYVEDMPVKEIAWILGSSRVAVKTMMFRARKKLMPMLSVFDDDHAARRRPAASRVPACGDVK
jgi:RNA polymerase sigma-70 factor (ECF subfamily)